MTYYCYFLKVKVDDFVKKKESGKINKFDKNYLFEVLLPKIYINVSVFDIIILYN